LQTGLSSNYADKPFEANVIFSNNFGSNNLTNIFLGNPSVPYFTKILNKKIQSPHIDLMKFRE
jgi:hypothetical protein